MAKGLQRIKRTVIRRRRLLLFAALAMMLFLAIAETVVRLGGWAALSAERVFTDVYDVTYRLVPGARNPWTDKEEFLNSAGFRGPYFPKERRPGVLRVICLGDSPTFGTNVRYEEAYPYLLEKALQARGLAVEVINAGMPGTTLWNQTIMYADHLKEYRPDLLVLYSNYGYRADYLALRKTRDQRPLLEETRRGLARLHLYRLLRRTLRPPKFEKRPTQYGDLGFITGDPQLGLIDDVRKFTEEDLTHLIDACRETGTIFLLAPLVSRYAFLEAVKLNLRPDSTKWRRFFGANNISQTLEEIAAKLDIPSLMIADAFLAASYETSMFLDEVHFSPAGHRVMTELLVKKICRDNLLPQPCATETASP